MMTLREFVEQVNSHAHYRVYQPNRDCLIFESYFKIHSPYNFNPSKLKDYDTWYQQGYWSNNDYCDDVIAKGHTDYDEETRDFLNAFGHYIVFSIEPSDVCPHKIYKDNSGRLHVKDVIDKHYPHTDTIPCFNLFIRHN